MRSDCAISTATSLPRSEADDLGEALRQRRRDALEGFVEQQQARADGQRARQRHELLLAAAAAASALRWRISATSGITP